jgi:hypothetical protein
MQKMEKATKHGHYQNSKKRRHMYGDVVRILYSFSPHFFSPLNFETNALISAVSRNQCTHFSRINK